MICPKCKSENVVIQDDSFDHDWNGGGTEVIRYPVCRDCGYESNDWTMEDVMEGELEEEIKGEDLEGKEE